MLEPYRDRAEFGGREEEEDPSPIMLKMSHAMVDPTDTWSGAAWLERSSRTAFLLGVMTTVFYFSGFLSSVLLAPLAALWTLSCLGDPPEAGESASVGGSTHTASVGAVELLISLPQLGALGVIVFFAAKALQQGQVGVILATLRAASASLLPGGVRRDKDPTAETAEQKRDAEDESEEEGEGEGDAGEAGKPSEVGDQHEEKEDGDSQGGREAERVEEKGGEQGEREERGQNGEDVSRDLLHSKGGDCDRTENLQEETPFERSRRGPSELEGLSLDRTEERDHLFAFLSRARKGRQTNTAMHQVSPKRSLEEETTVSSASQELPLEAAFDSEKSESSEGRSIPSVEAEAPNLSESFDVFLEAVASEFLRPFADSFVNLFSVSLDAVPPVSALDEDPGRAGDNLEKDLSTGEDSLRVAQEGRNDSESDFWTERAASAIQTFRAVLESAASSPPPSFPAFSNSILSSCSPSSVSASSSSPAGMPTRAVRGRTPSPVAGEYRRHLALLWGNGAPIVVPQSSTPQRLPPIFSVYSPASSPHLSSISSSPALSTSSPLQTGSGGACWLATPSTRASSSSSLPLSPSPLPSRPSSLPPGSLPSASSHPSLPSRPPAYSLPPCFSLSSPGHSLSSDRVETTPGDAHATIRPARPSPVRPGTGGALSSLAAAFASYSAHRTSVTSLAIQSCRINSSPSSSASPPPSASPSASSPSSPPPSTSPSSSSPSSSASPSASFSPSASSPSSPPLSTSSSASPSLSPSSTSFSSSSCSFAASCSRASPESRLENERRTARVAGAGEREEEHDSVPEEDREARVYVHRARAFQTVFNHARERGDAETRIWRTPVQPIQIKHSAPSFSFEGMQDLDRNRGELNTLASEERERTEENDETGGLVVPDESSPQAPVCSAPGLQLSPFRTPTSGNRMLSSWPLSALGENVAEASGAAPLRSTSFRSWTSGVRTPELHEEQTSPSGASPPSLGRAFPAVSSAGPSLRFSTFFSASSSLSPRAAANREARAGVGVDARGEDREPHQVRREEENERLWRRADVRRRDSDAMESAALEYVHGSEDANLARQRLPGSELSRMDFERREVSAGRRTNIQQIVGRDAPSVDSTASVHSVVTYPASTLIDVLFDFLPEETVSREMCERFAMVKRRRRHRASSLPLPSSDLASRRDSETAQEETDEEGEQDAETAQEETAEEGEQDAETTQEETAEEGEQDAETEEGAFDCCICMGEYAVSESLRRLPCMHAFHTSCLRRWIQVGRPANFFFSENLCTSEKRESFRTLGYP
ncbi:zinc finger, C3HC4 type (RING finger) domain-containing protein [Toxoplasma gondii VEG]|uniref:Zinc finger, C3HC4 type (RING finger) domain-containing protein n=1 Tax=Toxoplasma gondii (strain ATCC 50861 / VEG) TaxID=432359 RepID=V4Z9F1_TOXGV|nr:zinc finger, C3HC4 type (RING finger) domain-containing protein [Toxoplasma gondii VEG]